MTFESIKDVTAVNGDEFVDIYFSDSARNERRFKLRKQELLSLIEGSFPEAGGREVAKPAAEILWYACEKCGKIGSYYSLPDGTTTFPRGEFMAHRDDIVAGLNSEEKAIEWRDWFALPEPRTAPPPTVEIGEEEAIFSLSDEAIDLHHLRRAFRPFVDFAREFVRRRQGSESELNPSDVMMALGEQVLTVRDFTEAVRVYDFGKTAREEREAEAELTAKEGIDVTADRQSAAQE